MTEVAYLSKLGEPSAGASAQAAQAAGLHAASLQAAATTAGSSAINATLTSGAGAPLSVGKLGLGLSAPGALMPPQLSRAEPVLPSMSSAMPRPQLPNLSSVLRKIQSEQRLPLPEPTMATQGVGVPGAAAAAAPVASAGIQVQPPTMDVYRQQVPVRYYSVGADPNAAAAATNVALGYIAAPPQAAASIYGPTGPSAQAQYDLKPRSTMYSETITDSTSRRYGKAMNPRKYKCKICAKSFTTSGHLARHNRIHTGVKNHVCPFDGCNARFSRQDNCMQHYKTHLNGKKSRKRARSQ